MIPHLHEILALWTIGSIAFGLLLGPAFARVG